MREKDIEAYLIKRVQARGGVAYKFHASSRAGVPDRIVILGRTVFVELKAPSRKPRKIQLLTHEIIEEAGGEVYVIDSKQDVDDLVDSLTSTIFD